VNFVVLYVKLDFYMIHFRYNKKYFSRRYFFVAVFLIFAVIGLFSIVHSDENIIKIEKKVPVSMPTEINANFLNQVEKCFMPTASLYGYTLRISSGFRSTEEQNQIYEQGRVVDGHIVTEAPGGRSIHNFGYAVDVVDRWREYNINFDKLGKIAEYCKLEHGDEGDLAHFEYRDGLTTQQLLEGKRPAALKLPCAVMTERTESDPLTLEDLKNCGATKF
jgi:hypothetical protein